MQAINAEEIKKSMIFFIFQFVLFTLFSVFTIYLYFLAEDKEYHLLDQKVKETEELSAIRKDINYNLDFILLRFHELSAYKNYNADAFSKQDILIEDILTANQKIKDLVKTYPYTTSSFVIYDKLNTNISKMASLKDSLFSSRYAIESYKTQISDCISKNNTAINKIRKGKFRH